MQEVYKTMTAKEYLLQYRRLTEKLRALEADIIEYETIATNTTQSIDGMPHAHGPSDKVGSLAVKIADLKAKKEVVITEVVTQREEIRSMIDQIGDARYAKLLSIRYVELDSGGRLQTWDNVADQMHMEVSWVKGGLHSQALAAFSDVLARQY